MEANVEKGSSLWLYNAPGIVFSTSEQAQTALYMSTESLLEQKASDTILLFASCLIEKLTVIHFWAIPFDSWITASPTFSQSYHSKGHSLKLNILTVEPGLSINDLSTILATVYVKPQA